MGQIPTTTCSRSLEPSRAFLGIACPRVRWLAARELLDRDLVANDADVQRLTHEPHVRSSRVQHRERDDLRDRLIAAARDDERITAAAVVGSSARDAEDAWSDIDLALRLSDDGGPDDVVGDWTARMYESAGAVDHLDVWSGTTLFRVFLLGSSLQVDLSFWASDAFAASAPSFRLLFGEANDPRPSRAPEPGALVGMGWLYALHARSSIARGRRLQALYMINGMRDQVVALACLRHDLPAEEGRGVDDLPASLRLRIAGTLVRGLDGSELRRAFVASVDALLEEAQEIDPDRERRIRAAVRELVRM